MNFYLPKLIGHRGIKDLAPENTLFSIIKAKQFNLRWIEIDVKISKDLKPFLLHDECLDRTTSGSGLPYQFNYEQIKKLDAGSWFNKKYSKSYPPSLEEVLNLCSDKKIGLNIELKPNKNKEKENIQATFIGHPLLENEEKAKIDISQIIKDNKKIISIFPGSRQSELDIHLPILIDFIKTMNKKYNDIFKRKEKRGAITIIIKSLCSKNEVSRSCEKSMCSNNEVSKSCEKRLCSKNEVEGGA